MQCGNLESGQKLREINRLVLDYMESRLSILCVLMLLSSGFQEIFSILRINNSAFQ